MVLRSIPSTALAGASTPSLLVLARQARTTVILLGLQAVLVPQACYGQTCDNLAATAGKPRKWAVVNPMMVAPVNITYKYESYNHPMYSELTGRSITVRIPPDFNAGFNLSNPRDGSSEYYQLRTIELRKPGYLYEGADRVLNHDFEAAMVHQETTGTGYWANVIVPLQVGEDYLNDLLTPLVINADLPKDEGDLRPVLISGTRPLELNQVWHGASFLHSWTTLPTGCQGFTAHARQFMRNSTLTVQHATYHSFLHALERAPEAPPLAAPTFSWALVGCPGGNTTAECLPVVAEDLSGRLRDAKRIQTTSLVNLRNGKASMDRILQELKSNTTPSVQMAIDARDNLRNAQAELDGISRQVSDLQEWVNQASTAAWDSDKPSAATSAATTTPGATSAPTPAPPVQPVVSARAGLLALQAVSQAHRERQELQQPSQHGKALLNLLFGQGRSRLRHRAKGEHAQPEVRAALLS